MKCRIPGCDGNGSVYNQSWVDLAIPKNSKCERYGYIGPGTGNNPEGNCPASYFNKSVVLECSDGYIFQDPDSLIEELDIPCEPWKRTLIGTLHSVGTLLVLPLIGTFSDRFGRLHAMIISGLLEGLLGLIKGLSVNYAMFVTMELLEPTLGSGLYSSAYVLVLEFLTPNTRVMGGCLLNIFFGLGQVAVGFLAWLLPYWRTYIIVLYAPSFVLFFFYWIYDESPRWLMSKNHFQKAKTILEKVAKTNGKTIPAKLMDSVDYNIQHAEEIKKVAAEDYEGDEKKVSPWRQILRSRVLLLRIAKVSVWWITCTFCFYGLSINSAVLPGNSYVNFIIQAAIEMPAHFMAYLGMSYCGRKRTLFSAFLVGGLCLLVFPFIPTDEFLWLALTAYFCGKLCVTAAFNGIYLYTSELFPTTLRHSLLATCSMIGRIGSITAPQTPLLARILPELPAYMFASCCLISALLMTTSPETLGRPLPETVEDAENISASRRNILSPSQQDKS